MKHLKVFRLYRRDPILSFKLTFTNPEALVPVKNKNIIQSKKNLRPIEFRVNLPINLRYLKTILLVVLPDMAKSVTAAAVKQSLEPFKES